MNIRNIIDKINDEYTTKGVCPKCGCASFTQFSSSTICDKCGHTESIIVEVSGERDTSNTRTDKLFVESGTRIQLHSRNIHVNKNVNKWGGISYMEKARKHHFEVIKGCIESFMRVSAIEHAQQRYLTPTEENIARNDTTIAIGGGNDIARKTLEMFLAINAESASRKPVITGIFALSYIYACKNEYIYVSRDTAKRIFGIDDDCLRRANHKVNKVLKNTVKLQAKIDANYWSFANIVKGLPHLFPKITKDQQNKFLIIYQMLRGTQFEYHLQTESLLTGIMLNARNILRYDTYTDFDVRYIFQISASTINNSIEKTKIYFG